MEWSVKSTDSGVGVLPIVINICTMTGPDYDKMIHLPFMENVILAGL